MKKYMIYTINLVTMPLLAPLFFLIALIFVKQIRDDGMSEIFLYKMIEDALGDE
jgi:hypothetical protein